MQLGYCAGTRVGVGSDKTHGIGNPSLQACAEATLTDSRCDGSGYFDAAGSGNSWQCKCAETNCLPSNKVAGSFKIYQAISGNIFDSGFVQILSLSLLAIMFNTRFGKKSINKHLVF